MYNGPKTNSDLLRELRAYARLGRATLEAMIRNFNQWVADHERPRALARAEERTAYVANRQREYEAAYWQSLRKEWHEAAEAEFDEKRPPIEVPQLADLGLAKRMADEAAKERAERIKARAAAAQSSDDGSDGNEAA